MLNLAATAAAPPAALIARWIWLIVFTGDTPPFNLVSPYILDQVDVYRKEYPYPMSFGQNLKSLRTKRQITQQQLADGIGVSKATISDWEKDRFSPELRRLDSIAEFLGVEKARLLDDSVEEAEGAKIYPDPRRVGDLPFGRTVLAWEHPDELPAADFLMVPKLEVELSPEGDYAGLLMPRDKLLAFSAAWVRDKGIKPRGLAGMISPDNSMEPWIFRSDHLLVDTSQTTVMDGKVFALWYDGGKRIKRLFQLPGGGLRIKSDNSEHPTIEVRPDQLAHVKVLGRVLHRSGDGGLF